MEIFRDDQYQALTREFHAEVGAFIAGSGMSRTRFGIIVMNDPRFVFDLQKGRKVSLQTVDRVRAYMHDFQADAA